VTRSFRSRLSGLLLVLGVIAAVVVVAPKLLPDLNPFATETKDRPQPALLQSLQKLDEYRAARANLQQVVDVEQDAKYLPSFIKGERTVMVASGDVDASIDFSQLGPEAIQADWERRAVTITLPRAQRSPARLDIDRTRVVEHDRGVVDRVGDTFGDGGANDQRDLLAAAQRKLDAAARADKELLPTAERNTAAMLRRLALGLGYEHVTIRFAAPQV
jgi:hypothetical protein